MIESFGGRVTGSVSGKTDILLVGEEPGFSKLTQARSRPKVELMRRLSDLVTEGVEEGRLITEAAEAAEAAIEAVEGGSGSSSGGISGDSGVCSSVVLSQHQHQQLSKRHRNKKHKHGKHRRNSAGSRLSRSLAACSALFAAGGKGNSDTDIDSGTGSST